MNIRYNLIILLVFVKVKTAVTDGRTDSPAASCYRYTICLFFLFMHAIMAVKRMVNSVSLALIVNNLQLSVIYTTTKNAGTYKKWV